MAVLSKRIMTEVSRTYYREYRARPAFMDLTGALIGKADSLVGISAVLRKRDYALQRSVNLGEPYAFLAVPGVSACIVGLEDRRMVHGGLLGAHIVADGVADRRKEALAGLDGHGMSRQNACAYLEGLPAWSEAHLRASVARLEEIFYQVSGWEPVLMRENRLKALQQEQINQAIEDGRRRGVPTLYAFEKERVLLAGIRAGDRNGAREILNEMLAAIYLSSPRLVVLRARTIELMSCLTRAAIEDNPLMEPLIERNHAWTERLIKATSFENLSEVLMAALDEFIDGIYLHGVNRSNTKVHQALDYISANFAAKISVQSVADAVGVSVSRLAHLVKEFTGRTVVEHVHHVRIRHAQHLLERTSASCVEIGYEVGYGDQSYFIKHFRRMTGTTPARYRRFGAGA